MFRMMLLVFSAIIMVVTGVKVERTKKPNIVIMYMDDMGWGDIGANGKIIEFDNSNVIEGS